MILAYEISGFTSVRKKKEIHVFPLADGNQIEHLATVKCPCPKVSIHSPDSTNDEAIIVHGFMKKKEKSENV